MKGRSFGIVGNLVIGVIGAILGGFLFRLVGLLPIEPARQSGLGDGRRSLPPVPVAEVRAAKMTDDSLRTLFDERCGVVATVDFCHRRVDLVHLNERLEPPSCGRSAGRIRFEVISGKRKAA